MKKEISEFCAEHKIEMPTPYGGKEYSGIYVAIYNKYKHTRKEWETVGADGSTLKHCLLLYDEGDLKKFFKLE